MKRVVIIGGETHLGEITALHGRALEVTGVCMPDEHYRRLAKNINVRNWENPEALIKAECPDIAAIANPNDEKFDTLKLVLNEGCDVIVDKPLCIRLEEQERLEVFFEAHPKRRLLNLLTLRGNPVFTALYSHLRTDGIGVPAHLHVRMAVQLRPGTRPPWFLDCRRSGGLFLDLLIHGLDLVEWLTGHSICALTARTGNLGRPAEVRLRDHAAVFCELQNGATALVEGQRMLPDTLPSDYRVMAAGTAGFVDLSLHSRSLTFTDEKGTGRVVRPGLERKSIVEDWLYGGTLVPDACSLRANRLALHATQASEKGARMVLETQQDGRPRNRS